MVDSTATKFRETMHPSRFLDGKEIMKLLKCSQTMLQILIKRRVNPIPSRKIGALRRFPYDEVCHWMKSLGR